VAPRSPGLSRLVAARGFGPFSCFLLLMGQPHHHPMIPKLGKGVAQAKFPRLKSIRFADRVANASRCGDRAPLIALERSERLSSVAATNSKGQPLVVFFYPRLTHPWLHSGSLCLSAINHTASRALVPRMGA